MEVIQQLYAVFNSAIYAVLYKLFSRYIFGLFNFSQMCNWHIEISSYKS